MTKKLSDAQQSFMDKVDGKFTLARNRRERDGTVMPRLTEKRTVAALVRMGMLTWVWAGQDGHTYNGVVRPKVEPATTHTATTPGA